MIIRESLLDHSNSRSGTDPSPPEKVYRSLIAVSRWNYIYERSRCDRISSEESGSFVRNRLPVLLLSLEMNRNRKSAFPLISFAERLRKRVAPKKKRNSRMQFRFHWSIDKAESFDFTGRWLSSIGHIGLYDSILFRSNLSRFDSSFPLHLQVVSIRGSDSRFPASDPFDLFIIRNWSYAAQRRDLSPLPWRGEKKEKERTAHAVNR